MDKDINSIKDMETFNFISENERYKKTVFNKGTYSYRELTVEFIKNGISKYKELILNQQQPNILKISIPIEIQEENYKNKEYNIVYKDVILEGEYRKETYRKNHLKDWLNF